jgi:hypothetical protein
MDLGKTAGKTKDKKSPPRREGISYTSCMRSVILILLCIAAVCSNAQSAPATEEQSQNLPAPRTNEILALEQSVWDLYAKVDIDGLGALMHPDFSNLTTRQLTREETLNDARQELQGCSVSPISIVSPAVTVVSPDVALIVYKTKIVKQCGHSHSTMQANMTTVWSRRDGRWKMQMHSAYITSGFSVRSE